MNPTDYIRFTALKVGKRAVVWSVMYTVTYTVRHVCTLMYNLCEIVLEIVVCADVVYV